MYKTKSYKVGVYLYKKIETKAEFGSAKKKKVVSKPMFYIFQN